MIEFLKRIFHTHEWKLLSSQQYRIINDGSGGKDIGTVILNNVMCTKCAATKIIPTNKIFY